MENPREKRSSIFVDVLLLTAIFAILFSIIFFTLIDKRFTFAEPQNEIGITNISPSSETTESESTFPGVKIITDISNDPFIPFAIQYPLTLHELFNNQIEAYIEIEKNEYISQMNEKGKFNNEQVGELNISFETYSYIDAYYSFILTRTLSIPGEETIQTVNTYFLNNKTGDLLTIRDVLSNNDDSLQTFSAQLQALMQDHESFAMIDSDQINIMAAPSWKNYECFSISEDNLTLFMHPIEDALAAQPLTIKVSLSSINTLLKEEFQIQMEDEMQVIVDPNSGSGKRIALTFDDGPHPDVTPQILAILEKYNAKATFFMLGSRVQYYPDIARDVFKGGHEIGNHTWNHPVLTKMSKAQILKEYTTTEQAIVKAIGTNSTIFRPPYGASNSLVKSTIDSPQINWSIDTLDWKFQSAPKLLPAIKNTLHNNAIILMHDIHLSTADGLEDVLQYLRGEGFEFVTVSEILNDKE